MKPNSDQRQRKGETDLHPLPKRALASPTRHLRRHFRQRHIFRVLRRDRLQTAPLLTEFRARIIHCAERPAQFLVQIRGIPALGSIASRTPDVARSFRAWPRICSSFFCVS